MFPPAFKQRVGGVDEEDTLILTAMSATAQPDDSTAIPQHRLREVFFASVQSKLRSRGIYLRHQVHFTAVCLVHESHVIDNIPT